MRQGKENNVDEVIVYSMIRMERRGNIDGRRADDFTTRVVY